MVNLLGNVRGWTATSWQFSHNTRGAAVLQPSTQDLTYSKGDLGSPELLDSTTFNGEGMSEAQDSTILGGVGTSASQASAFCEEGQEMVGKVEARLVLSGFGTADFQGASGSRGDSGRSEGCWIVGYLTVRGLMISRISSGFGSCHVSSMLKSTSAIGLMRSSFE